MRKFLKWTSCQVTNMTNSNGSRQMSPRVSFSPWQLRRRATWPPLVVHHLACVCRGWSRTLLCASAGFDVTRDMCGRKGAARWKAFDDGDATWRLNSEGVRLLRWRAAREGGRRSTLGVFGESSFLDSWFYRASRSSRHRLFFSPLRRTPGAACGEDCHVL